MNKSDLIKALRREMDLPIRKVQETVDMVFDTMSRALIAGDRIEIRGFGSFTVRQYEGYTGRNPRTGEKKVVAPKETTVFQDGTGLEG